VQKVPSIVKQVEGGDVYSTEGAVNHEGYGFKAITSFTKLKQSVLKLGDFKDALAQYCNVIESRLYPTSHNLFLSRNEKIVRREWGST